jgi:hypothetical protein
MGQKVFLDQLQLQLTAEDKLIKSSLDFDFTLLTS